MANNKDKDKAVMAGLLLHLIKNGNKYDNVTVKTTEGGNSVITIPEDELIDMFAIASELMK